MEAIGINVQEELLRKKIDPALTNDTLSEVAHRALRSLRRGGSDSLPEITGYRILTGGCWNRVISVSLEGPGVGAGELSHPAAAATESREIVLKISPHENDADIIREYKVLSRFAELSDFPVPRPLYLDAQGPQGPNDGSEDPTPETAEESGQLLPGTTLVMTKIPGRVMHQVFGRLSPGDRKQILDQLTEDVVRLHRNKAEGFGGVEVPPESLLSSWPHFWLPRLEEVVRIVRDAAVLPDRVFEEVGELWPYLQELLEIGTESTLTHYDIWAGNVMIDPGGRRPSGGATISGYIDIPGNWADYAWEISFMQVFGLADESFLRRYSEAHGVDDTFEQRLRAYQLRTFMKHVMMYPGESYYRQGTDMCLESLRRGAADRR